MKTLTILLILIPISFNMITPPPYTYRPKQLNVTATMYYQTGKLTSSGVKLSKGMIAISRNLHKRYGGDIDFFDTIHILDGHRSGKYIVTDLMDKRFTDRIDIYEPHGTPIYKYDNLTIKYK